mgnify:CR=1 FL=1
MPGLHDVRQSGVGDGDQRQLLGCRQGLGGQIGDGQTLCGQAMAAIGRKSEAAPSSDQTQKSSGGVAGEVGKAVKGVGEEIKKGLKDVFGN